MNIVKLSNTLAVSAQINPEDIAGIVAAGYRILINNRPDDEEWGQPSSRVIGAAARAAGMEYHHLPVTAMSFPGADFDTMSDLLDHSPQPVLAFCRTGTRCANLWVACSDEAMREEAKRVASERGFDLGMATNFLARSASRE